MVEDDSGMKCQWYKNMANRGLFVLGNKIRFFGFYGLSRRFLSVVAMDIDARRRMLTRRSHQRGMLELDLLLGPWADQSVQHFNEVELTKFEELLKVETPELLKMCLGQLDITPVFLF